MHTYRFAAALPLLLAACGTLPPDPTGPGNGQLAADFSLLDVNPASATYNQDVSPRDYLGRVSAWYFGHAD